MLSVVMMAKIREWQVVKPMIFSMKNGNRLKDLTLHAVHLLLLSATPKSMYLEVMMVNKG